MEAGKATSRPPVLVLAPRRYWTPLGVMRSLAPLGVRVYAPLTHGPSLWKHSRLCAGLVEVGEEGASSTSSVEDLVRIGLDLGGDAVLLPCSDEWVRLVAKNSAVLGQVFRLSPLGAELAGRLSNKYLMSELAAGLGLNVPATTLLIDRASAAATGETIVFPAVVKTASTRSSGNHWRVVASPSGVLEAFDRFDDPGNLICQHLVAGRETDGWLFNGYFDHTGRCLMSFTGRKLRQSPPVIGAAVLARAECNREVSRLAIEFLSRLGYCGPVDMDFVFDRDSGSYQLLDVNIRLGGIFRAFVDHQGLDVAIAAYLDLTGQPFQQEGQVDGRRLLHEGGYAVETVRGLWRGRTSVAGAWRDVRGAEMGSLSLTDPLPLLIRMAMAVQHRGASWERQRRRRKPEPSTAPAAIQSKSPAVHTS